MTEDQYVDDKGLCEEHGPQAARAFFNEEPGGECYAKLFCGCVIPLWFESERFVRITMGEQTCHLCGGYMDEPAKTEWIQWVWAGPTPYYPERPAFNIECQHSECYAKVFGS